MSSNKVWKQIAFDAIDAAENVDCSFGEFVRGLKRVTEELQDRLQCAEDELRSHDAEDEE